MPEPTTTTLARVFARVLEPLTDIDSRDDLVELATNAGVEFEAVLDRVEDLDDVVADLDGATAPLETLLDDGAIDDPVAVLDAIGSAFDAVESIRSLRAARAPPFDPEEAARRLGDYLVVRYFRRHQPGLYGLFVGAGILREGDSVDLPPRVNYDRVGNLFTDPVTLAEEVFEWGTGGFPAPIVAAVLQRLFYEVGVPAVMEHTPGDYPALLAQGQESTVAEQQVFVPIARLDAPDPTRGSGMLGLAIVPLYGDEGDPGVTGDETLPGIAFVPVGVADADASFDLGAATLTVDAGVSGGVAFVVRPGELSLVPLSGGTPAEVSASLALVPEDGPAPRPVLGDPEGTRIELGTSGITVRVDADGSGADLTATTDAAGSVVVTPDVLDGFLSSLLTEEAEAPFETTVGWGTGTGLVFDATGSLDVTLPDRFVLGPVTVEGVTLSIGQEAGSPTASATATLTLVLGPFAATVEGMGVAATVSFPAGRDGTFGPVDLDLGFDPPDGIGITVDAAAVSGGGYLYFDHEAERYAGALELDLGGIAVSAIGLLTTRLPSGRDGFSLLVIITGEFPPLQLGFGFTLNAVGGLLGVHRRAEIPALQSGVRDGTLDSVLFPENPVENAPRIISDLRRTFPPATDTYVFGPMARLGWGTPTILTADLGVLIELPRPKLVVLGRLAAVLPDEDVALVLLQMAAVGVVDFDRGTVAVDASLYDSRVSAYALSGDMALRTGWKDDPGFTLAVGGFNPRYDPPETFPELRRVSVSIARGNNPRFRLTSYFALTANTVQFGAAADLYAAAAGFSIAGELGFDVLFRFDPFEFVADLYGRVKLRGGPFTVGVNVEAVLSGPGPYHARGHAAFEFLFLTAKVRFDVTIGEARDQPPLPPASVLPVLVDALERPGNWDAQRPTDGRDIVTVRTIEPGANVLVHPLGSLTVRERAVPLDVTIDRFGSARPDDGRRFAVTDASMSGGATGADELSVDAPTAVREAFAPAQFFDLTDAEKLDAPAFERLPAGYRLAPGGVQYGGEGEGAPADVRYDRLTATATLTYETSVVDRDETGRSTVRPAATYTVTASVAAAQLAHGAVATAPGRTSGDRAFVGDTAQRVGVRDTGYVVASTVDATRDDATPTATTYTEARTALREGGRGSAPDRRRIVPSHLVADGGGEDA